MHIPVLILGGGITGLSTAWHLEQGGCKDYLVLEKENTLGGLCRTEIIQNCVFDYSGHLLHLHTDYGKKLIRRLLKNNLKKCQRKAWIFTKEARVPFPFQANLFALPEKERRLCLQGLSEASQKERKTPRHFKDWCLQAFGKGIYDLFMRPYNTKLWGLPPEQLSWAWCGSFVPTPDWKEIEQGARQKPLKKYGYNAFFYYPKKGGAQAITDALSEGITSVKTDTSVTQIDLKNKKVRAGGKIYSYDYLVNTLPLPVFLRLLKNNSLTRKAEKLRHTSVYVFNFAIDRKMRPFSWIYFPDESEIFYRVGMQSSFSEHNAPKGVSSFYVEVPAKEGKSLQTEKRILKELIQKGIIKTDDKILFSFWQTLPYAYAVYDKNHAQIKASVLPVLEKSDCFCAGRYGLWEYSFMEKSLLQGSDLAKKILELI